MLKRSLIVSLVLSLCLLGGGMRSWGQCTTATINWDNLDYLERNTAGYSTYITAGMYAAMVQTQSFAIGVNRLTISHNYTSANNLGENATNTVATGADVQYKGNGVITITFDNPVTATTFSLFDVDRSQRVAVTALNGASAVNVNMVKQSGSVLTVVNSGTANPVATATSTTVSNSSSDGALNITIPTTITSFTITVTLTGTCNSSCGTGGTEDGSFWLSDISACVTGSFPNSYYAISQPFTNQPAYVLAVHDLNTVYMVDPATGRAVSLFTDPYPRVREINDLAYDPYKRIVYYSIDGLERCTPVGNPDSIRHIKKYDFNTETISTLISNVNNAPFNIPTFSYGLESGAAAFYNSCLFIGVEGTQSGSTSTGREASIWRIEFAADSITPVQACQIFAQPVDNGSNLLHDWGDVILKDGIMYDFNASSSSGNGNYNIYNMQTDVITNTYAGTSAANKPRQAAQQWDGTLRWLHTDVALYNGTNVISSRQTIVAAAGSVPWVAGAGDAAEAFKPKADFGDAPSTYDPNAMSPALNERDTALHIGATYDWEWNKNVSLDASGDGGDEDGLAYVPVFAKMTNQYVAQVQVWNNTGATASLCAWFDYNGNGVFDASEGIAPITVNSMASNQSFYLSWTGISTTLNNNDVTYLRIRLASTALTAVASMTGYYRSGETEDYQVIVDDFPLSVNMLSFDAKALNSSMVRLDWTTAGEEHLAGFEIERSADRINWQTIGSVPATGNNNGSSTNYLFNDIQALKGRSYYRLKLIDNNTAYRYSEIRNVLIKDNIGQVTIMPNPARTTATISISSETNAEAIVSLYDMQGRKVRTDKYRLLAGGNSLSLNKLDQLPDGTYIVQFITGSSVMTQKLVIGK